MKLKRLWTEDDIEAGIYIIRDTSPINSENMGFARTVVYKIGYQFNRDCDKWGKISCLTDGLFTPLWKTKLEITKYLNEDKFGYRPLTKDEYIRLIQSTNQGFIHNETWKINNIQMAVESIEKRIKLEQDILYITSWKPFDFQNMGQKAVELKFTSGDTQMLTTPIDPKIGNDKGDFKDEAEMMEFITYLQKQGIPRDWSDKD